MTSGRPAPWHGARRRRDGRGSCARSGAKHRSITSDGWPSGGRQPLIILGLDTTTRSGSAAVLDGDRVLSEVAGDGALTHGQRLPGDIGRALAAAGITLDDLDLLAVVAGPGSFTGLRIGIAAIQGLALARDLRVVPVSALEAIGRHALRSTPEAGLIGVWIDAQRGEVFASLYDGAVSRVLQPPSSALPDATLASWADALASRRILFSGDGAIRYREAIAGTLGSRATVQQPAPLLAAEAARIAADHPERAGPPHAIVPIYVRRPDVELSRGRAGR